MAMENPLIHAVFMGKSSANERFNIVEYGCDNQKKCKQLFNLQHHHVRIGLNKPLFGGYVLQVVPSVTRLGKWLQDAAGTRLHQEFQDSWRQKNNITKITSIYYM